MTDVPLADRPTSRYRFYDGEGAPIYFGAAVNPEARWEFHRYTARWWPLVDHSRTLVDWYPSRRAAMDAEAEAIAAENPTYNKMHTVRGMPVTQFKMELRDLLERSHLRGEFTAITWYGQRMGVLVPSDWFDRAQELMATEDRSSVA